MDTGVSDGTVPPLGTAMSWVGSALLSGDWSALKTALSAIWTPILLPMLIGGMMIGSVVGTLVYFIVRRGAAMFRENRRNHLMEKATHLRERAKRAAEQRRAVKAAGTTVNPGSAQGA